MVLAASELCVHVVRAMLHSSSLRHAAVPADSVSTGTGQGAFHGGVWRGGFKFDTIGPAAVRLLPLATADKANAGCRLRRHLPASAYDCSAFHRYLLLSSLCAKSCFDLPVIRMLATCAAAAVSLAPGHRSLPPHIQPAVAGGGGVLRRSCWCPSVRGGSGWCGGGRIQLLCGVKMCTKVFVKRCYI